MSAINAPEHPRAANRPDAAPDVVRGPSADVAPRPSFFRRPAVIIALALIALVGIAYGARGIAHSFTHESTDDAFIDAHIIAIAPKISGRVTAVHVKDNQEVKKGDLLVEIDPADAAAVVAQKRAAIEVARAKQRSAESAAEQADAHLNTLHAGYEAAGANASAAEADVNKQRGDLQRNQRLIASGAISTQEFAHTSSDTQVAESNLQSKKKQMEAAAAFLQESLKQAQAAHVQVEAAKAEVTEAEATAQQANLQASYAAITAPEDGRVTTKAIEAGAYVQIGQNLLALVTPDVWVTANFKETQLQDVRPGLPVAIAVDAYPDHPLRGHVDSIQAGSGARFSLLPPENATGNYVKVVQRVPVKIVLDEKPDVQRVLGPGMSAVPEVEVSSGTRVALVVGVIALLAASLVILGAALWIGRSRLERA